ncbi:MAG: hypothetical protein KH452_01100 [Clostridiales bacterium]|nr:hypothetical protein [Clostridiales bacterium]
MILADVYVPALNDQFDFKLDENVYVADLLEELGDQFLKDTPQAKKDLLLCSLDENRILPLNQTLKQSGITSGCRLLLL